VVTAAGSNWRYGAAREKHEKLEPLLEALQELRDGGLTATGVVAAIHRRRVLPLTERRLPLSEMMPGVDLEGSQMSSVPLSADDLRKRVAGTVGRLDADALTQPLMRPERGCMSLVSVCSFFFLVLDCPWFSQSGFPSVSRSWGVTSLPCHQSQRTRWTEPRGSDDKDDDDDEDDDMTARLGLSPDLRLGQGSSSQPLSGLAPSVSGAGTSGSQSKEQGQAEGVLDPLAEVVEVTPGSQVDPSVPQEQSPVPAAQEVDPRVVVTTPGRTVPSVPRAPEAGTVPKPATGQTSVVPAGTEARGASPQARLALVRSG
jgi:hypothetical protein